MLNSLMVVLSSSFSIVRRSRDWSRLEQHLRWVATEATILWLEAGSNKDEQMTMSIVSKLPFGATRFLSLNLNTT
jgi:hypothetical protein